MSFVCHKLISRSQKWVKHSVVLFSELRNRGSLSQFSSVAYVWGAGDGGQLGTGNQDCSLVPTKLPVPCEVSHVGCGYSFTVAAEANSCRLWTTGLNSFSQLGRKLQGSNEQDIGSVPAISDPHLTSTLSARVQDISCGRSHSAVLMDDGRVLTCGGNYHGQCGVGNKDTRSVRQFTQIQSVDGKIIQVACGSDHTLLLSDEGKVVSCGWGADGQTGLGHFKDEATFTLLQGELKNVRIKQIATSADCCLALSDEGEVFSWGNNEYGQLAIDSEEEQFAVPTRASLLNNLPEIAQVAAGGAFCVVLTVTGELYSWGYGVLGHGPEINFSKTPRKILEFSDISGTITRVMCGPDNTAVITDSGALYTWGRGSFGRLGLGSTQDQWIPKKVDLPGEVIEVSCGVDHMSAVVECR